MAALFAQVWRLEDQAIGFHLVLVRPLLELPRHRRRHLRNLRNHLKAHRPRPNSKTNSKSWYRQKRRRNRFLEHFGSGIRMETGIDTPA